MHSPNTEIARVAVVRYFSRSGSRLGYRWLLGGAKHFGYYPDERPGLDEAGAQRCLHDLLQSELGCGEGASVLDAGCGEGVVSTDLALRHGLRVTGVTIVPFETGRAENRARELGVADRTRYLLRDYSDTGLPDASFDALYTTESLSHSGDLPGTLRELRRLLKPGARAVFCEYHVAPLQDFSPDELRAYRAVAQGSAMHALDEFVDGRFPALLQQAEFTDVAERRITRHMMPSLRRLQRYARLPHALFGMAGIASRHINTLAACECYRLAQAGRLGYAIYTARSPGPTIGQ